jgi:hypothetical protein
MRFCDGGETTGERVIELRRHQFVSYLRRSRCDEMQTVVTHDEELLSWKPPQPSSLISTNRASPKQSMTPADSSMSVTIVLHNALADLDSLPPIDERSIDQRF